MNAVEIDEAISTLSERRLTRSSFLGAKAVQFTQHGAEDQDRRGHVVDALFQHVMAIREACYRTHRGKSDQSFQR